MTYHKYVSGRNFGSLYMTYMIASANRTWLLHRAELKYLLLQFKTSVRAMTAIRLLNNDIRKQYDSANLQPKMSSQSEIVARTAYKRWIRNRSEGLEGHVLARLASRAITERTSTSSVVVACALPMMRGMLLLRPGRPSTRAM